MPCGCQTLLQIQRIIIIREIMFDAELGIFMVTAVDAEGDDELFIITHLPDEILHIGIRHGAGNGEQAITELNQFLFDAIDQIRELSFLFLKRCLVRGD